MSDRDDLELIRDCLMNTPLEHGSGRALGALDRLAARLRLLDEIASAYQFEASQAAARLERLEEIENALRAIAEGRWNTPTPGRYTRFTERQYAQRQLDRLAPPSSGERG